MRDLEEFYIFEYKNPLEKFFLNSLIKYKEVFLVPAILFLLILVFNFSVKLLLFLIGLLLTLYCFALMLHFLVNIPFYININKYKTLKITKNAIFINKIVYDISDLTVEEFSAYTRMEIIEKSLCIYNQSHKRIGKFYFQISNSRLFPMDAKVIELLVKNLKTKNLTDNTKMIFDNILKTNKEEKQWRALERKGLFILLPIIIIPFALLIYFGLQ